MYVQKILCAIPSYSFSFSFQSFPLPPLHAYGFQIICNASSPYAPRGVCDYVAVREYEADTRNTTENVEDERAR
jgi:hypothetical protein